MGDEIPHSSRAEELVEQADAVLGELDTGQRVRLADRLPPGQIGRLLVGIGTMAGLALAAATLAIVLTLVQFSTRVDIADDRAAAAVTDVAETQRQLQAAVRAAEASDCRVLAIGRLKPTDPRPSTDLGRARAAQYEEEYLSRGCPP